MAAEGLPVQLACRVLGVSESGYYDWRGRPPSTRALRHAWLTELIRQIHTDSRGVYGVRRVHAVAAAFQSLFQSVEVLNGHLALGFEAQLALLSSEFLRSSSGAP